ncbi:pilus assembly protein PilM [Patescibacteria group bacterium]|nr:pilus assembly protein PilM [Patescibacteria group bacterium]
MKLNFVSDFFSDILNFFKGRAILGVDIGTASIKIAEVSEKNGRYSLVNYGILETKSYLNHPNKAIQTSSLTIVEKDTSDVLKILINEMKPKTKLATASIPSFSSFSTVIDMPLLSPTETAKAVSFQAPQYIPIPVQEVMVDWFKIDEFQNESGQKFQHVFVVGISKNLIQKYKNVFKEAGLRLVALEFDGLPIVRSLMDSGDDETVIVDIGAESTDIFVASRGQLEISGETDYSGIHLTQSVARSLGITSMRAEELKRRKGLSSDGPESELSTLTIPFLDVIIQEVNHVAEVFKRRYGREVKRLMMVGGGANLIGIGRYFAKQTGLIEAKPNLFRKISYDLKLEPILGRLNNELPTAIGLAEKYFQ